jgi:hypothetical protein
LRFDEKVVVVRIKILWMKGGVGLQTAIVIWNSGRVDYSYSGIAYFPGIAVVELKP